MSWEPPFANGPGSAELTDGRRFLRMLQRNAKYVLGTVAAAIVAILLLGNGRHSVTQRIDSPTAPSSTPTNGYVPDQAGESYNPVLGTPVDGEPAVPSRSDDLQVYAISLVELPGLPPDATPGTKLDLWVTWQPPVTREPKVQLLIEDVTLETISAPITVDGPYVANLLVGKKELPDLLYGDRFGDLNVSVSR